MRHDLAAHPERSRPRLRRTGTGHTHEGLTQALQQVGVSTGRSYGRTHPSKTAVQRTGVGRVPRGHWLRRGQDDRSGVIDGAFPQERRPPAANICLRLQLRHVTLFGLETRQPLSRYQLDSTRIAVSPSSLLLDHTPVRSRLERMWVELTEVAPSRHPTTFNGIGLSPISVKARSGSALTSSEWIHPTLRGPPSTGRSAQSAISAGSRAEVDSMGRIRSPVPCRTSTGTSIFGTSARKSAGRGRLQQTAGQPPPRGSN
jgi:hypothetical protein